MSTKNRTSARAINKRPSWSLTAQLNSGNDIKSYINHFRNIHLPSDIDVDEEQQDIRLNMLQDLAFLEHIADKNTLTYTEQSNLNVFLVDETHYAYPIAEGIRIRYDVMHEKRFMKSIERKPKLNSREQRTLELVLRKSNGDGNASSNTM